MDGTCAKFTIMEINGAWKFAFYVNFINEAMDNKADWFYNGHDNDRISEFCKIWKEIKEL